MYRQNYFTPMNNQPQTDPLYNLLVNFQNAHQTQHYSPPLYLTPQILLNTVPVSTLQPQQVKLPEPQVIVIDDCSVSETQRKNQSEKDELMSTSQRPTQRRTKKRVVRSNKVEKYGMKVSRIQPKREVRVKKMSQKTQKDSFELPFKELPSFLQKYNINLILDEMTAQKDLELIYSKIKEKDSKVK